MREEASEASTEIKSSINYKMIEEILNDQYKRFSVFEDQEDGCKQKSVPFVVYDLAS